jgi:hypothetical protein
MASDTYRVIVHTDSRLITAVHYATRNQALASVRQFMRKDGYRQVDLVSDLTGSVVSYTNKHFSKDAQ